MMKPVDYVNVVVLPTVREQFADKADMRRGVLACIVTYHVVDHVAHAEGYANASPVCDRVRSKRCDQINIVQGICHGTKHAETKRTEHHHRAGDAILSPAFAFDDPDAGWGKGAWGGPALASEHNGQRYTWDECVIAVLVAIGDLFPQHFPADELGLSTIMALHRQAV